jgi:hypothetical protein
MVKEFTLNGLTGEVILKEFALIDNIINTRTKNCILNI